MYEMDKREFGAFVAMLRKEKGFTQKELAGLLHISDKAVSKWETGVSIPDVMLLVPLSEALGVSVTELLKCRRLQSNEALDCVQVEDLVKTAIVYSEESPAREQAVTRKNIGIFAVCVFAAVCEVAFMILRGYTVAQFTQSLRTALAAGLVIGFYFLILTKKKLPGYYDANRVTTYNDGPVRMNLGFVQINNRNWPHIVKVFRWWSMGILTGYPLVSIFMNEFAPRFWMEYEKVFLLICILGGMLVPVMVVGKKYS